MNEIKVMEEVAETTATSGLTRNQKVGIVVAASVLTAGVAYGVFRLVKFLKARKANKEHDSSFQENPVQE